MKKKQFEVKKVVKKVDHMWGEKVAREEAHDMSKYKVMYNVD